MFVSDFIFPHDSAHPPASTDLDHALVVCDYFFIFGHYLATGHSVSKNNIRVLCREQQWHRRKVKEAIYIKQQGLTMNRDQGYQLPPSTPRSFRRYLGEVKVSLKLLSF